MGLLRLPTFFRMDMVIKLETNLSNIFYFPLHHITMGGSVLKKLVNTGPLTLEHCRYRCRKVQEVGWKEYRRVPYFNQYLCRCRVSTFKVSRFSNRKLHVYTHRVRNISDRIFRKAVVVRRYLHLFS
jgi:hypothetical protein